MTYENNSILSIIMHEIIDNFLCAKDFLKIKKFFCDSSSWKFTNNIVESDIPNNYKLDDYMFNHLFYQCEPFYISKDISVILPIIEQLKIKKFIRCKANFYNRTEKIVKHDYHVDTIQPHLVALYYANTNNGFTIFEDGKSIESIENRLIIFDGKIKHASTTASNNVRMNININFVENNYNKNIINYV